MGGDGKREAPGKFTLVLEAAGFHRAETRNIADYAHRTGAASGPRSGMCPAAGRSGEADCLGALSTALRSPPGSALEADKQALHDFLLQHARRYDFSAAKFGSAFLLLVNRRFLCANAWRRMEPRDAQLAVMQCMRVLMRDAQHRATFVETPGAVARLVELCVELADEHFSAPDSEFFCGMLVETLSILKRFAALPELLPPPTPPSDSMTSDGGSPLPPPLAPRRLWSGSSPGQASSASTPLSPSRDTSPAQLRVVANASGRPSGGGGGLHPAASSAEAVGAAEGCASRAGASGVSLVARLHGALVSLLSTREALVLQCVLVALYNFVQDRHRSAIGSLACAESLLRIVADYEPSFKAPRPIALSSQPFRLPSKAGRVQVPAAELLELLLHSPDFATIDLPSPCPRMCEVVAHDGALVLLSLLHCGDEKLPPHLLRSLHRLAKAARCHRSSPVDALASSLASNSTGPAEPLRCHQQVAHPPSAKEVRQVGGIQLLLSILAPREDGSSPPTDVVIGAVVVLATLSLDQDAALQARPPSFNEPRHCPREGISRREMLTPRRASPGPQGQRRLPARQAASRSRNGTTLSAVTAAPAHTERCAYGWRYSRAAGTGDGARLSRFAFPLLDGAEPEGLPPAVPSRPLRRLHRPRPVRA